MGSWDIVTLIIIAVFWIETKGKILEEIDALFEDRSPSTHLIRHADLDVEENGQNQKRQGRGRQLTAEEVEAALVELEEVGPKWWQYDYSRNEYGVCQWSVSSPTGDLADILPVPTSVKVRVLLVEGVTDAIVEICRNRLDIPEEFFRLHKNDNVRIGPVHTDTSRHSFSTRWSRSVHQAIEKWDIERRIAKEAPWSVDTLRNPAELRLDHILYERIPGIFRRYFPISQPFPEELHHAAREAISTYWIHQGSYQLVLVVVDPPRRFRATSITYRFWGTELPSKQETNTIPFLRGNEYYMSHSFAQKLESSSEQELMDGFVYQIQIIIVRMMVEDTTVVVNALQDALDDIDLSLSKDDILRNSLLSWRERFGFWRLDLINSLGSVRDMIYMFEQHYLCPTCAPVPSSDTLLQTVSELNRLKINIDEVLSRLNLTFQAVMSTMSIVESQKAIQEAETVSRLTRLAAFFIPLSFVASLFGMNLLEFDGKLKVWMWVTVSVGVTLLTYIVLFLGDIARIIGQIPQFRQEMNMRRIGNAGRRQARVLIFKIMPVVVYVVLFLGIWAGMGVGLWKLYTSHLSVGAKVGISLAIFLAPTIFIIPPMFISA